MWFKLTTPLVKSVFGTHKLYDMYHIISLVTVSCIKINAPEYWAIAYNTGPSNMHNCMIYILLFAVLRSTVQIE